MKKLLLLGLLCLPRLHAAAQIEIIQEAIKAAIEAVDLGVKKLQTETILLQDAQRVADNIMQQTDLHEIEGWVSAHRDLYAGWLSDLWKVKQALAGYERIRTIISREERMIQEAQEATSTFQRDPHFSAAELATIERLYNQLLQASVMDIGQLTTVITSLVTSMDDGSRLNRIDAAGQHIDQQSASMRDYTEQVLLLSLQRSKDAADLATVKALYGL